MVMVCKTMVLSYLLKESQGFAFGCIMEELLMPLFLSSLVFVLSLIALASGIRVLLHIRKNQEKCTKFHAFLAQAIIVLAIIMVLLSGFATLKCLLKGPWYQGGPAAMHKPMGAMRR